MVGLYIKNTGNVTGAIYDQETSNLRTAKPVCEDDVFIVHFGIQFFQPSQDFVTGIGWFCIGKKEDDFVCKRFSNIQFLLYS